MQAKSEEDANEVVEAKGVGERRSQDSGINNTANGRIESPGLTKVGGIVALRNHRL